MVLTGRSASGGGCRARAQRQGVRDAALARDVPLDAIAAAQAYSLPVPAGGALSPLGGAPTTDIRVGPLFWPLITSDRITFIKNSPCDIIAQAFRFIIDFRVRRNRKPFHLRGF